MTPTDFPQANKVFTKPEGFTDEQCSSLPVWTGIDNSGIPCMVSYWQPSQSDIDAINRGEGIYLSVIGERMPPVALFVENPFITV